MTASVAILTAAVVLVGALWLVAQARAAAKEFSSQAERRWWVVKSLLIFAAIVFVSLAAGASGKLSEFDRLPPPMAGFFLLILATAFGIAFSKFGSVLIKHTPMSLLIGFQGFRVLAEAVIYAGVREGIAPVQMSFEGCNFDIVTGVTAPIVMALLWQRDRRALAYAWNLFGVAALVVIAFIAFTSMPLPIRIFDALNLWVTRAPHVMLPGVLVLFAILGHILAFRKLATEGRTGEPESRGNHQPQTNG